MEEFEKLVSESFQSDLLLGENETAPAAEAADSSESESEAEASLPDSSADLSADGADEKTEAPANSTTE
jgi:hypothetical protein